MERNCKYYMVKNIMGAIIAAAVAVGAGTTGIKSNTTTNQTRIVKSAQSTSLTDYHSNVRFTKSSDIKKISASYQLNQSDRVKEIVYLPVNDYSTVDAYGQKESVSVETRLASYSVKKKGFKDKISYLNSSKVLAGSDLNFNESLSATFDFSDINAVSGGNAALRSCLKSAYGPSVTKTSTIKDTLKISSKNDSTVQAYVIDRTYDYQLWQSDLSHDVPSDSYLGSGMIKRPVGVVLMISENK